jgi:hypothetical protein
VAVRPGALEPLGTARPPLVAAGAAGASIAASASVAAVAHAIRRSGIARPIGPRALGVSGGSGRSIHDWSI